jgi:ATP phosphoribosyltransferase regulatory subunit
MLYQPPAGARDLLPLDVAQKRWIEHRLQQVFHSWCYHRIITPTLERVDTLMAGGAVRPETVIQVWDAEAGSLLGLRPELTASIARAAVTRMAGVTYPQRLYYIANIFRRQPSTQATGQHEFFQAGVELLGIPGSMADAEVLLILADALQHLGLTQWHLILGEANLTQSLLAPFPEKIRGAVRDAIAQLDRIAIQTLPLEDSLRDRALRLMDLRGKPADVLQALSQWPLEPGQLEAIATLKTLVDLVQGHPQVVLDLSLVQTFDYYTGIVFEVVSQTESTPLVLAQGGRYDQLLSLYHPQQKETPGIGFSLNIQELHRILQRQNALPQSTPRSDWLVVAETPKAQAAALAHAQQLRTSAPDRLRVELVLDGRSPQESLAYAQNRQISQIAWVNDQGQVKVDAL